MREVFTPQVPEGWMDDRLAPRRWKWHEPVCYSFPRRWHRLWRAPELTERTYWLFWGLYAYMGWENRVTASVRVIGKEMGLAPATIPRALRRLERAGLIVVDRRRPTQPIVTISPFLVWQGRPQHLYERRKTFMAQVDAARARMERHTPVPR